MENSIQLKVEQFKKNVWEFYTKNKRPFAWRQTWDPYQIVVSEIMLQQTQTSRVEQKFVTFLKVFPTFKALAESPFSEVLKQWVGLGYNRRALALHGIAQRVVNEFNGQLPDDVEVLKTFKGLGHATASSIVAFVFNKPTVFIETNIRAVFLYSFYKDQDEVHDKELLPFIELTACKKNSREWYYALMDYGVYLKKLHKNPSKRSKHYSVQSKFEGSDRQIRGAIVRLLSIQEKLPLSKICSELSFDSSRIAFQYKQLLKEGLIER